MFLFAQKNSARLLFSNQKRSTRCYFTSLLLMTALISSCGFQLRGAVEISQDVSPIFIEQNSAFRLARDVKGMLASNHITVTDKPASANAQLTLLEEVRNRRVLSVDTSGQAREYLLSYTVNFSVRIKHAKAKDESITLTRSLLFDTTAVIAVANESEVLYEDMRREASRLILLKLQAHALKSVKANGGKNSAIPSSPNAVKI